MSVVHKLLDVNST